MATVEHHVEQSSTIALPRMTRHASERRQQRSVPSLVTSLILEYGTTMRHAGADVVYLDKEARKRLRGAVGGERNLRIIEPWLNTYLVAGDDGEIITLARRQQRFRRP